MNPEEFRTAGHTLIDQLADFYASLPGRRVTAGESVTDVQRVLPPRALPAEGTDAGQLLSEIAPILFEHSLHNGHPRFFGYITSSAAPFGALADLLAAGINQNCGLRDLSPAANEIERQTIGWLAELIGLPGDAGGIMVSGGNVANMLGFFAARRARLDFDLRRDGLLAATGQPRVYASRETHTWIEKAADISGIGTAAIRWIATDAAQRIRLDELDAAIQRDRAAGDLPFLVVGTAGNVSTGAVDPLADIAAIAAAQRLWFHVDGAYGAPAACLPEASPELKALARADSVALDPHKWLYAPIEAACTLVRDPQALQRSFSYRPRYYRLESAAGGLDYFEHGLQNTRGFRALKVWLGLRESGRSGFENAIRRDMALARQLYERVAANAELEPGTQNLSITTFRFRPADARDSEAWQQYLNRINETLLAAVQNGGDAYLSHAVLDERYFLRACIVNFRTQLADIEALIDVVVTLGRKIDSEQRATARLT